MLTDDEIRELLELEALVARGPTGPSWEPGRTPALTGLNRKLACAARNALRPLCDEVLRLRAHMELVAGSLRASIEKRDESPLAAMSHLEEAVRTVAEYAPADGYGEAAAALRKGQWSESSRLRIENAALRGRLEKLVEALSAYFPLDRTIATAADARVFAAWVEANKAISAAKEP